MNSFIEAVELRKTYHVGKIEVPALRGISFSVPKGEFVSVVGPSGSGKSTLFYLLGGLTHADSGHVVVDGFNGQAMFPLIMLIFLIISYVYYHKTRIKKVFK